MTSERASDAPGRTPVKVPPMRYRKMAFTLAVAVFAAVISYSHIYSLGLRYGGSALTARLLPLVVDGMIAAVSAVMLADSAANRRYHWLTWVGLITGIGATVAANVGYGLRFGITGAVLWAAPPVMFVLAIEITLQGLKRDAVAPETHSEAPASEVVLESVPDQVPSVRAIMREKRVGRPRALQIRAELEERTA